MGTVKSCTKVRKPLCAPNSVRIRVLTVPEEKKYIMHRITYQALHGDLEAGKDVSHVVWIGSRTTRWVPRHAHLPFRGDESHSGNRWQPMLIGRSGMSTLSSSPMRPISRTVAETSVTGGFSRSWSSGWKASCSSMTDGRPKTSCACSV